MHNSSADELRAELRDGTGPMLRRRRGIVALSLFSGTILGGIALFQMGVLKRLPQLPAEVFDPDAVHGSETAYSTFQTPDALLGVASYALTACLAGAGGQERWRQSPAFPLAMGAKTAFDALNACQLQFKSWTRIGKLSIWSLLVAGATLGSLFLALPEVEVALRRSTD